MAHCSASAACPRVFSTGMVAIDLFNLSARKQRETDIGCAIPDHAVFVHCCISTDGTIFTSPVILIPTLPHPKYGRI